MPKSKAQLSSIITTVTAAVILALLSGGLLAYMQVQKNTHTIGSNTNEIKDMKVVISSFTDIKKDIIQISKDVAVSKNDMHWIKKEMEKNNRERSKSGN